jgi:hypothetical protein
MISLFLALILASANAAQTKYKIDRGKDTWSVDAAWKDHNGKERSVSFKLPTKTVEKDLSVPLGFKRKEHNKSVVTAVNNWGKKQKAIDVQASKTLTGKINIKVRGTSTKAMKDGLKRAAKVRDTASEKYFKRKGYTELSNGAKVPDHALFARRYADDVAPLVKALKGSKLSDRAYAQLVLGYVQSIPYEKGLFGDKGYRRPISILAKNKGDCDSKSALYLAILKRARPKLPIGIVYVPGHSYVGLGLKPQKGDVTFKKAGRSWVMAEPVGPAMPVVGKGGPKSMKRAKKGRLQFRAVE